MTEMGFDGPGCVNHIVVCIIPQFSAKIKFLAVLLSTGCVLGQSMMLDVFQYACAHRRPAALPGEQNSALKRGWQLVISSFEF